MSDRNSYLVAAFNPFWRYAVALDNRPDLPAIPFFTKCGALGCFDRMRAELPSSSVPVLLKRRLFGRVDAERRERGTT